MKAKLLIFLVIATFSSNAFAEYYLVYPTAAPCEPCYKKVYKKTYHKKRYVAKPVKKKAYVAKKRKSKKSCIPCGGVVQCSPCGEYVSSSCGNPDYVVYTAPSTDCVTYDDVQRGEQYGDW